MPSNSVYFGVNGERCVYWHAHSFCVCICVDLIHMKLLIRCYSLELALTNCLSAERLSQKRTLLRRSLPSQLQSNPAGQRESESSSKETTDALISGMRGKAEERDVKGALGIREGRAWEYFANNLKVLNEPN